LLSKNIKIKTDIHIILFDVLYRCEPWSLTIREEHRSRVLEKGVLTRTFGPKRDEVIGEKRRLHNNLYCSSNIVQVIKSRRVRWEGHVARMGRKEMCIQGFGGET
jgi:hypothetical protein